MRKGAKLNKLKCLYIEGKSIALNLSDNMSVLRRYILEYEQWLIDSLALLNGIGGVHESDAQTIVASFPESDLASKSTSHTFLVENVLNVVTSSLLVNADGDTLR